ncbi:MAG: hypothetical protein KIH69_008180 [Anaerolineae bacterium]|nr:hypothetical protein [Anaerolineae bacterium]
MQPNRFLERLGQKGLKWNDQRSQISLRENKKEYRAMNHERKILFCYHIDGEMIEHDSGQKACDYGLGVPTDNRLLLIELKGKNLAHAIKQISDTLDFLGDKINNLKVDAHIILSRNNPTDLKGSDFRHLEAKLKQKQKGTLKTHSVLCEDEL